MLSSGRKQQKRWFPFLLLWSLQPTEEHRFIAGTQNEGCRVLRDHLRIFLKQFLSLLNFILYILFIYFWLCWVFVAAQGLCLVAASGGYSPVSVHGLLIEVASLLQGTGSKAHRFSSCGSLAQLPSGLWNLPRPGIKLVSPAWAGRFSSTGPLRRSCEKAFYACIICISNLQLCSFHDL